MTSTAILDLSFPHSWEAEILPSRPAILPQRHFTYPREAEEVERGALELLVRPHQEVPFLGTFALGFADAAVPSGVWSCPDADAICAVAGGYAYVVNTRQPQQAVQLSYRPVLEVRPVTEKGLLLFSSHYGLLAWGRKGRAWESPRLSAEGVRITEIRGDILWGLGWDLLTDRDVPFAVNLDTGERVDLSYPAR